MRPRPRAPWQPRPKRARTAPRRADAHDWARSSGRRGGATQRRTRSANISARSASARAARPRAPCPRRPKRARTAPRRVLTHDWVRSSGRGGEATQRRTRSVNNSACSPRHGRAGAGKSPRPRGGARAWQKKKCAGKKCVARGHVPPSRTRGRAARRRDRPFSRTSLQHTLGRSRPELRLRARIPQWGARERKNNPAARGVLSRSPSCANRRTTSLAGRRTKK